jgi:hypothetical protein
MSDESKPRSRGPSKVAVTLVWCIVAIVTIMALMVYVDSLSTDQLYRLKHTIITVIACIVCSMLFMAVGLTLGRRQERQLNAIMRGNDRALPVPPVVYSMPMMPQMVPPSYDYARPLSQNQGTFRGGAPAVNFATGDYEAPSLDWGDM